MKINQYSKAHHTEQNDPLRIIFSFLLPNFIWIMRHPQKVLRGNSSHFMRLNKEHKGNFTPLKCHQEKSSKS